MSDVPTTVNPGLAHADEALSVAMSVVETMLEKYIEAEIPFFALPLIKDIEEYEMRQLLKKVQELLQPFVSSLIIDAQIEPEKKAVKDASDAYRSALAKGDQNEIDQSRAKLADSFGNLIHFDGA